MSTSDRVTAAVRERYGEIAEKILAESSAQSACCDASCCGSTAAINVTETRTHAGCCDTSCCGTASGSTISQDLYAVDELDGVPLKAALASLGCGNPTALAELRLGETVLDLGSGGGIDVLLSARRVGPSGFAYGLDMTDAMLALAQRNAAEAGVQNVAFLKGDIAAIPLPDNSVDVIISNCVINLAADKTRVVQEAFRVLKPGGRFAVSDIVIHGGLPTGLIDSSELRRDLLSWASCIAGALTDREYRDGLAAAGFDAIDLEITRRYTINDVPLPLPRWAAQLGDKLAGEVIGRVASTFVRARKA